MQTSRSMESWPRANLWHAQTGNQINYPDDYCLCKIRSILLPAYQLITLPPDV